MTTATLISRAASTLILSTILLLGLARPAVSQPLDDEGSPGLRFGLFGGLSANRYAAGITALPGVPSCCPAYESGSGFGWTAGLSFSMPLSPRIDLGARFGYARLDGELTGDEEVVINVHGETVVATIRHSIAATLPLFYAEPFVRLRPLGRSVVRLAGWIGLLGTSTYDQKETLLRPAAARFENGERVRMSFNGEMPEVRRMQNGVTLGIGYELPLSASGSLIATPEASITYALGSILRNDSWQAHAVRLGVSVEYAPPRRAAAIPEAPAPPAAPILAVVEPTPPPFTAAPLSADVDIACLDGAGRSVECVTIEMERVEYGNNAALLPYLFFDDGIDTLPARYHRIDDRSTATFDETTLEGDPLTLYYDLLNIVGSRMRNHPRARITVIGCNADVGAELGDTALSRRRADAVRAYLLDVWEIEPKRIDIRARNLPEIASRPGVADGDEENRRVEIRSDEWEILRPIVYEGTLLTPRTPTVEFHPTAHAAAGSASWTLQVRQAGWVVKEFAGTGAPPDVLPWTLGTDELATDDSLRYTLTVTDRNGRSVTTAEKEIDVTVRESSVSRSVEKYNLIIFPYNSSEPTPAHRKIAAIINGKLTPASVVTTSGHTDRMGDPDYNLRLSTERADAVADMLDADAITVTGEGATVLLYDNTLPEGRYYCRTVNVVIETELE